MAPGYGGGAEHDVVGPQPPETPSGSACYCDLSEAECRAAGHDNAYNARQAELADHEGYDPDGMAARTPLSEDDIASMSAAEDAYLRLNMVKSSAAVHPGARSKAVTTNPKDLYGSVKVDVTKVPAIAVYHEAMAMMDGADKYGPYNWRDKPVIASIYVAAAKRHMDQWFEGQELASDSGAHHLGHARACCGIILDAQHRGCLVDDRPIKGPDDKITEALDEMSKTLKRREKFKKEGAETYAAWADNMNTAVSGFEPKCPYNPETEPFETNYWTRGYKQRKEQSA